MCVAKEESRRTLEAEALPHSKSSLKGSYEHSTSRIAPGGRQTQYSLDYASNGNLISHTDPSDTRIRDLSFTKDGSKSQPLSAQPLASDFGNSYPCGDRDRDRDHGLVGSH